MLTQLKHAAICSISRLHGSYLGQVQALDHNCIEIIPFEHWANREISIFSVLSIVWDDQEMLFADDDDVFHSFDANISGLRRLHIYCL